ncbi:MAG: Lipopolysaccharide biosynthesis protein WzxC [Syntrophorhabdus sp. PtaU1.Bin153]|nr:MAG: Lipopolysaccharide biosynthesis protein WzxC [Syntrophorhabdus sp. PtaU1.Bin153]
MQTVVLIILARLLTPSDFGILGAATIVIGFSQIFTFLGIGPAIVQRTDLTDTHTKVGFTFSVAMGCLTGIVIIAVAARVAWFFRMPELEPIIKVLALVFPITGLGVVSQSLLQREMQFRKLAFIQSISYALGYGSTGICLAFAGWGPWALVVAQISQASINTCFLLCQRPQVIGFACKGHQLRQLLNFGSGFSLSVVASYIATHADNLIVGRLLGPAALGIYGRAYQFLMVPTILFGTVIEKVFFPAMAEVQRDRERLARVFSRTVGVAAMILFPTSGLLILFAPEIIRVLLGARWEASIAPFQLLASILLFRTSYKFSESLAKAMGAVYRRAWRDWVYAGAVTGGSWAGHFFGVNGVALGVAGAVFLNFCLMMDLSVRLTGASWRNLTSIHFRHLIIGFGVTAFAWFFKAWLVTQGVPPLIVLLCAGTFGLILVLSVWRIGPGMLGEEGLWVRPLLKHYLGIIVSSMRAPRIHN